MNENAPNLADLKWLRWAQQLQALAQSGLQYTTNLFDIERYQKISRLAAEIMADGAGAEPVLYPAAARRAGRRCE